MFDKKDSSECKEWLKTTHPELFAEVYAEEIQKAAEAGEGGEEVAEPTQ